MEKGEGEGEGEKKAGNIPFTTPCAAKNIAIVSALEKMTFCPELRYAREVEILIEAFS